MQHRSPRAAAVGVDLGTSTTTVSFRGRGERSTTRVFDGLPRESAAAFDRVRAFRDEAAGGTGPVAVVAPASWERDRSTEVADAAEAAGLDRPSFIPASEAAAVYVESRGHEFEPGTALVVYELGAASCEVGVVRRDGDGRTVLAARAAGGISGGEFDHLVLAYLSGRHGDDDREFWDLVADPAEETLRPALLDEIRRARERLSERPSTEITLYEAGLELQLTQQELESCIGELVEQSCDLAAAVMEDAGVDAEEAAGLLLTGGASRTPLVVARLTERTGLKPVLPERPEQVAAEGAAIAALSATPPPDPGPSRLRRTTMRVGVLAALLVVLVGVTAFFGSELGSGVSREAGGTETTSPEAVSESASPSEGDIGSGGAGGAPSEGSARTPTPADDESSAEPTTEEAPSPTEEDREESATAGTVPDLTAMSSHEADETLADAGFTNVDFVGERDSIFGPWYDDCEVKGQDPAPDTHLAFDEPITVTYSYSGSDTESCEP